jgi:hypothetical protein
MKDLQNGTFGPQQVPAESTSEPGNRTRGSSPSVGDIDITAAIFYAEHPLAIARDFAGDEQAAALRRIDRVLEDAREQGLLPHHAFERRNRRREHVGTHAAARRILARLSSGDPLPDSST